jgi:hypothetical protein
MNDTVNPANAQPCPPWCTEHQEIPGTGGWHQSAADHFPAIRPTDEISAYAGRWYDAAATTLTTKVIVADVEFTPGQARHLARGITVLVEAEAGTGPGS